MSDGEATVPAKFFHREDSPTAASSTKRLFGPSGAMTYRVTIAGAMGMMGVDVEASTGDDAAMSALAKYPGAKVAHVAPAPRIHAMQDAA